MVGQVGLREAGGEGANRIVYFGDKARIHFALDNIDSASILAALP